VGWDEQRICGQCKKAKRLGEFWSEYRGIHCSTCQPCRDKQYERLRLSRERAREATRAKYKCADCGGLATERDMKNEEWTHKYGEETKRGFLTMFRGRALCCPCLIAAEPSERTELTATGAGHHYVSPRKGEQLDDLGEGYHDSIMFTPEENMTWNANLAALKARLAERVRTK
jgi:DNA-directed RNA polymerase subunit RPC12/RpoP